MVALERTSGKPGNSATARTEDDLPNDDSLAKYPDSVIIRTWGTADRFPAGREAGLATNRQIVLELDRSPSPNDSVIEQLVIDELPVIGTSHG
jgi:hypothetical protein